MSAEIHDYRENTRAKGAELIVRPRNKYGTAKAGDRVLVDEKELLNPATRAACMTSDESAELEKELLKAREAAEAKQKSKGSAMAMVDSGLDQIAIAAAKAKRKATDESIESQQIARRRAAREAADDA